MGKGDSVIGFLNAEMAILGFCTGAAVVACAIIRFGWRRRRKMGD
jgi:hypothetical protein